MSRALSAALPAVISLGLLVAGPARGAGTGGGPPGAPPTPPGMRMEVIHDRGLNMDAYYVAVPTDWHFQGAAVYGTACSAQPFPVFRASSPDGFTVLERLPRFNWSWGTLGWHPQRNQGGCLPLKREVSASEFLRHLADMLQVEYVAEVPTPPEIVEGLKRETEGFNALGAEYARTHPSNTEQHGEVAQAKVRYQNGSFKMESLLFVKLICTRNSVLIQGRPFWSDNCGATVRVVRAPQGKLEDAVTKLKFAGATPNLRWSQAYMQLQARNFQASMQQNQQRMDQQAQQFQQSQASQQQAHEQFMQSQAVQQHQHEQFLATMQRGTDMSMARAAQSASASHTAASDMVDYALNQQTVRDPSSGQLNKVSSGYNYTWVDDTGKKSYQTRDPNANPNGYVPGNWSLQQQVHGDGTGQ